MSITPIKDKLSNANDTSEIDMILDGIDDKLLNKEIEYILFFWKTKEKSTLKKQVDQLKELLQKPVEHFMESSMRWWSEFRHFLKYVDF
jgi:hypothetical protein